MSNRPIQKNSIINQYELNEEKRNKKQDKLNKPDNPSKPMDRTKQHKVIKTKYDKSKLPNHINTESSSRVVHNTNPRRITKTHKRNNSLSELDYSEIQHKKDRVKKGSRRVFREQETEFSNYLNNNDIDSLFNNTNSSSNSTDNNNPIDIKPSDNKSSDNDINFDELNTNSNLLKDNEGNLIYDKHNTSVRKRIKQQRVINTNKTNNHTNNEPKKRNISKPVKQYNQHSIKETSYNPIEKSEKINQTNIPYRSVYRSDIKQSNTPDEYNEKQNKIKERSLRRNPSKSVSSVKAQSIINTPETIDTSLEPNQVEYYNPPIVKRVKGSRVQSTIRNDAKNPKNRQKNKEEIHLQNNLVKKSNLNNGILKADSQIGLRKKVQFIKRFEENYDGDYDYNDYEQEINSPEIDSQEDEDQCDSNQCEEDEDPNENEDQCDSDQCEEDEDPNENKDQCDSDQCEEDEDPNENEDQCDSDLCEDIVDSILFDKEITWEEVYNTIKDSDGFKRIEVNSNGQLIITNKSTENSNLYNLDNIKMIGINYTDIIEIDPAISFDGSCNLKNLTLKLNTTETKSTSIFNINNKRSIIKLTNINILANLDTNILNINNNLIVDLYLNNTNFIGGNINVPKNCTLNLYIENCNIPLNIISEGLINIFISSTTKINETYLKELQLKENININYLSQCNNIKYNNSNSGICAKNVQTAIDELRESIIIPSEVVDYDGVQLQAGDLVPINPSDESINIWLPDVNSSLGSGINIGIINITNSFNEIILNPFDESQLINGESSFTMNKPYQSVKLISINKHWFIL